MLKLGDKTISKLYLGSKAISKAYLGDKLVFQAGKPIPSDYTQLEYISIINNQQQRFNNAFELPTTFEQADKIEMTVSAYSTIPNNAMFVTGHTPSYSEPYLFLKSDGSWASMRFENPIITPQYSSKQDFIDRGKQTITFTYTGIESNWNGKNMLFGSWMDVTYSASLNWYGVKVYKNNEVLHNLVPAIRNSDNEVGMYDTVTEEFLTNVGTGGFITGDIV